MKLVMDERGLNSRWRDVVFTHAPKTDRDQGPLRTTNGRMTVQQVHREWFAQRRWEDDGGRTGLDSNRAAR